MTGEGDIAGYPSHPSVRAGSTLLLHVSTSASRFRADVYRFGAVVQHMGCIGRPGEEAPPGRFDEDWEWPAYEFQIPEHWPSGVYVVVLRTDTQPAASEPDLDARTARALFVVTPGRTASRAQILYKIPVFTYQAYNTSGGGSLYGTLRPEDDPAAVRGSSVSLRRPGGGTGGPVKGFPDPYDAHSPRQTFAHWDAKVIAWMERNGIACDFCTDLDLHEGDILEDGGYRLLLSAGHDEYWSARTREHVERHRDRGGNIANFGANTCWWRASVVDDDSNLRCEKFPADTPLGADPDGLRGAPDHWWETAPENQLLGTSYRNGGGHWEGHRTPVGFRVQHAAHWAFDGTGLRDGDTFGRDGALVGYECDGAAFVLDSEGLACPTGDDGTPEDFRILGFAELPEEPGSGWHYPARERSDGPRAATLGIHSQGGSVFTAGTTDWPRLLETDPTIQKITRNVIARLSD